jgi:hypothetical protein
VRGLSARAELTNQDSTRKKDGVLDVIAASLAV